MSHDCFLEEIARCPCFALKPNSKNMRLLFDLSKLGILVEYTYVLLWNAQLLRFLIAVHAP